MLFEKTIFKMISLSVVAVLLVNCAAKQYGDGIIVAEHPIVNPCEQPKHPIRNGAIKGATTGAIAGGAIYGTGFLLLAEPSSAVLVAAGIGALAVGVVGAVVGTGSGLIYYGVDRRNEWYEYSIKSMRDGSLLTVKQYAPPLPLQTHVSILERSGDKFIRKYRLR